MFSCYIVGVHTIDYIVFSLWVFPEVRNINQSNFELLINKKKLALRSQCSCSWKNYCEGGAKEKLPCRNSGLQNAIEKKT